jgi:uncharacterized phage protein (TIGR01671 family)
MGDVMRYKFRAWDKENKTILHGVEFIDGRCWDENLEPEEGYQLNNVELMQYTGLLDKNGKEIFEGDIVRHNYSDGSGGKNFTVEIGSGEAFDGFDVCGHNKYVAYTGVLFKGKYGEYETADEAELESLEVIGNIYENGELCES